MKNLLKILAPVLGLSFSGLNYTIAQDKVSIENNANDTIFYSETSSVIEEIYNKEKVLEKKEYIIEKNSQKKDGKVLLETETKYSFKEKDLGRPTDPKEPKNILNRKLTDKLIDYLIINEFQYDSLGRLTEIERIEDSSPGQNIKKRSKVHYTYEGADKNPVRVWEDVNNDDKYNQGDKMKVYVKELDKWVSQEE